jgi:hypothetical protein
MSEIDRIRADMARCRQRIAEMREGKRGVRTGPWIEADGMPGAGLAFSNQQLAQETALARLEAEYVQAMIPVWGPAAIISKMEAPPPEPPAPVQLAPSSNDIKTRLREFLFKIPDNASVASLKELIQ